MEGVRVQKRLSQYPFFEQYDYLSWQFSIDNFGEEFEQRLDHFDDDVKIWFRGWELVADDSGPYQLYDDLWLQLECEKPGACCNPETRVLVQSLELDFDPNSGRPGFEKTSVFIARWWDGEDEAWVDSYFAVWSIACTPEEIVPEPVPSNVDAEDYVLLWQRSW